jgi:hypothetical protein
LRSASRTRAAKVALVALGIFGAALFYGDGMITPAISVLSAVEGLAVVSPSLESLVLPIALVILTGEESAERRLCVVAHAAATTTRTDPCYGTPKSMSAGLLRGLAHHSQRRWPDVNG